MLNKYNFKSCVIILFLAAIIFLPTTAFAGLFGEVERIEDTYGEITLDKLIENPGSKFSNIYKVQSLSPLRVSETKNSKVRQSILLAAKKGADKFSIGTQRSPKGKYIGDKSGDGSAPSYEITSNDNQTYTLTRQGLQMEPLPAEDVEDIREIVEIIMGHSDYMIALKEAQGILDSVVEGSVLGQFSGDMKSGVGSEFLPEDNDRLFNREAIGKSLINKYDSFGGGPGSVTDDQFRAAAGAGKAKAGEFGVKGALSGLGAVGRATTATATSGAGMAMGTLSLFGGLYLFLDKVYHSLPDPSKSSGEKFLEWLEKYPGMTEDQKNETRYQFYENSCKNSNEYCEEYKAEKKKREQEKEKPGPDDIGNGGVPERIELTKSQKDWWATVLTTGWIPEETNPGPDGGQEGGFELSPEEHARLLQELMILADIPWSPISGQPAPDQDYRNYQVANDGTITMTDLILAGQPLDDDDGSFGVKKQPQKLGGPKPVGGINQHLPEGEPFQGSSENRPNVPFPEPMK